MLPILSPSTNDRPTLVSLSHVNFPELTDVRTVTCSKRDAILLSTRPFKLTNLFFKAVLSVVEERLPCILKTTFPTCPYCVVYFYVPFHQKCTAERDFTISTLLIFFPMSNLFMSLKMLFREIFLVTLLTVEVFICVLYINMFFQSL